MRVILNGVDDDCGTFTIPKNAGKIFIQLFSNVFVNQKASLFGAECEMHEVLHERLGAWLVFSREISPLQGLGIW